MTLSIWLAFGSGIFVGVVLAVLILCALMLDANKGEER